MERLSDLAKKDVINLYDGCYLGRISDIELELPSSEIKAIVIYGKLRFLGLFGREDDIIIHWPDIEVVGEDSILVRCRSLRKQQPRRRR